MADGLEPGRRVRLLAPMRDDYPPPGIPAGTEGTVDWVNQDFPQVGVRWDNGRSLMLLPDVDDFEVLECR